MSPIEPSTGATSGEANRQAISLADFDLIRVIGRGSYAKVLMVELKNTKRIYAMKVIKKELVTDDEVRDQSFFITWLDTARWVDFEQIEKILQIEKNFQLDLRWVKENASGVQNILVEILDWRP